MATGWSENNASDECFNIFCNTCFKIGKRKEAEKFCVDCYMYFCAACVEDHNKFYDLAQHNLLKSSQFGTDSVDLPPVTTERCKIHPKKLVDMYCLEHDSIGCYVCFTIQHRHCQDIHYIPEYIQTLQDADIFRLTEDEIVGSISKIQDLVTQKQIALENNTRDKMSALEGIKIFRADLNQVLDRMEKASVTEVNVKYTQFEQRIKKEQDSFQETLEELRKYQTELQTSRKNQSQQYVISKLCEKLFSETNYYKTESNSKNKRIFARNSDILAAIESVSSLGQLKKPQKRTLYKVEVKDTYSVKQSDEPNDCNIWSSCLLDNSDILLADVDNNKLTIVQSKTYTVRDSLVICASPYSACRVDDTEVAVSMRNKTVQFVSTKDKLIETRSLKFNHSCRGIAVMDGNLVVCEYGQKALVYTMEGELLRTIEKDECGNPLFRYISEIAVSNERRLIHVADNKEFLIAMDKEGKVIWKCSHPALNGIWGVYTDGIGNVFVTCFNSNNVLQIGPDGQYMGEVIPASYGLNYPKSVCFDEKHSKMIVARGNELFVFTVR